VPVVLSGQRSAGSGIGSEQAEQEGMAVGSGIRAVNAVGWVAGIGSRRAVGSGLGQLCLKSGNATTGFCVSSQQLAALMQAVGGAKRSGELIALDLVALQPGNQKLNPSSSDVHEQNRLRGRSKGGSEGLPSDELIVAPTVAVGLAKSSLFTNRHTSVTGVGAIDSNTAFVRSSLNGTPVYFATSLR